MKRTKLLISFLLVISLLSSCVSLTSCSDYEEIELTLDNYLDYLCVYVTYTNYDVIENLDYDPSVASNPFNDNKKYGKYLETYSAEISTAPRLSNIEFIDVTITNHVTYDFFGDRPLTVITVHVSCDGYSVFSKGLHSHTNEPAPPSTPHEHSWIDDISGVVRIYK